MDSDIAIRLSEMSAPNTWLLLNPVCVKILELLLCIFWLCSNFCFFFLIKKLHYNDFSALEGFYNNEGKKTQRLLVLGECLN